MSSDRTLAAKPAIVTAAEWDLLPSGAAGGREAGHPGRGRRRGPAPTPADGAVPDGYYAFTGPSGRLDHHSTCSRVVASWRIYQFMDAGPDTSLPVAAPGSPTASPLIALDRAGRERRQLGDRLGHAGRADASGYWASHRLVRSRTRSSHGAQLLRRSSAPVAGSCSTCSFGRGTRSTGPTRTTPAWGGSTECSPTAFADLASVRSAAGLGGLSGGLAASTRRTDEWCGYHGLCRVVPDWYLLLQSCAVVSATPWSLRRAAGTVSSARQCGSLAQGEPHRREGDRYGSGNREVVQQREGLRLHRG